MAKYTQKAILNGFEEMLTEMPFNKITVSALVVKCEISSNTFYYHFRDIYDLLDVWLDTKKEIFLKEAEGVNHWGKLVKLFLSMLQAHPQLVYHVSDSISRERLERYVFISIKSIFYEYLKESMAGRGIDETILKAVSKFCCFAFLGVTLEFVWGHMEANIDQMVEQQNVIFDGVIEYVIARASNKTVSAESSV